MNYNDLIDDYEVDVDLPDVSGIEHLDMLLTRSELAAIEQELTPAQRQRLYQADQMLIEHAQPFYDAIRKIASLEQWRRQHDAQITHWWWYLDVIAQMSNEFQLSVTPVYHYDSRRVSEMAIKG